MARKCCNSGQLSLERRKLSRKAWNGGAHPNPGAMSRAWWLEHHDDELTRLIDAALTPWRSTRRMCAIRQ
jgi:hypothetical protein